MVRPQESLVERNGDKLELTPRAMRKIAQKALPLWTLRSLKK